MESEERTAAQSSRAGDQYRGYVLLLIVICLWTGSSFLTNAMFTDMDYNKPFLTTYLCTATFALYLAPQAVRRCARRRNSLEPLIKSEHVGDRGAYAPVGQSPSADTSRTGLSPVIVESSDLPPLTTGQTATLALMFCTVWFAANVTINMALAQTSVSSVTILSSLSGLFTLVLGSIFSVEKFNMTKLVAVISSILGVILVSKADNDVIPTADLPPLEGPLTPKVPQHPILGDILAIASAACYAIYTLLLKAKTGDESRISMTLFFGFVGAWNILLFWPILLILNFSGLEPLEWPRSTELGIFLLINASITFVSDMLMMKSMLLTSPLAVTLGLSLTIPLAVVGDLFRGTAIGGFTFFAGAALVLGGFVAVGIADAQFEENEVVEAANAEATVYPQARRRSSEGLPPRSAA